MITLLLVLVQFAFPVTNAYAQQVKEDVVVSVTYELMKPSRVCVSTYALEDGEMVSPLSNQCWKPTTDVGDLFTLEKLRIDEFNFKVVVDYSTRPPVTIYLAWKVNT